MESRCVAMLKEDLLGEDVSRVFGEKQYIWLRDIIQTTVGEHMERLEKVKTVTKVYQDVFTFIESRIQDVKSDVRRESLAHAQRMMEERLLRGYIGLIKSQNATMNASIQEAMHELTITHAATRVLHAGLYKGFSLANSLMDEISKQSLLSNTMEEDLRKTNLEISKLHKNLVTAEEERVMVKAMEQSISRQLTTLNQSMAERASMKCAAGHDILVSQMILHHLCDDITGTSTKLDGAIADVLLHADNAATVAENLHSMISSLANVPGLTHKTSRNSLKYGFINRSNRCARVLATTCMTIPELWCISATLNNEGCKLATLEHVHLMERCIKSMNKYKRLCAKRKALSEMHENVLAQEQVLLAEVEAARTCLATKQKEVCQKMLQEDLRAIEAKEKAEEIFRNIGEASLAMESFRKTCQEETNQMACLKEEEAHLKRHKFHLIKALREIRYANAKSKTMHEKKKASNDASDQNLSRIPLHKENRHCSRENMRDVENQLLETSVRQHAYQTIIDVISEKAPQNVS